MFHLVRLVRPARGQKGRNYLRSIATSCKVRWCDHLLWFHPALEPVLSDDDAHRQGDCEVSWVPLASVERAFQPAPNADMLDSRG